jgi:hypothetical protein
MPEERGRSLRTAATITAVVGAAHALLFLLSWWLLSDAPGPDAPDADRRLLRQRVVASLRPVLRRSGILLGGCRQRSQRPHDPLLGGG